MVAGMRRLGTAIVPAAVLLLVAVGGCAGSGTRPGATPSPSPTVDLMALAHELAVCARAHGMPTIGDPTLGSDGRPHFPNEQNLPDPPPQSVLTGCRSILDRINAAKDQGNPHYQPKPADVPKLIQFAQCMRGHGFPNWPDPQADGTFPAAQMPRKTPALGSAMTACRQFNPDPQGRIPAGGPNGH
jgi:hypothetical protein